MYINPCAFQAYSTSQQPRVVFSSTAQNALDWQRQKQTENQQLGTEYKSSLASLATARHEKMFWVHLKYKNQKKKQLQTLDSKPQPLPKALKARAPPADISANCNPTLPPHTYVKDSLTSMSLRHAKTSSKDLVCTKRIITVRRDQSEFQTIQALQEYRCYDKASGSSCRFKPQDLSKKCGESTPNQSHH